MINIKEDDIRRVARQLDALYTALKCFVYYTEVKNILDIEKHNVRCWDFIEFTLMYTMLINWNEIFGINCKSTRWKEITIEQEEYTDRLYSAGEFNYSSWYEYRKEINNLCNSFITHPDPYHHKNQEYNLIGLKLSLEITHDWLHDLVADNKGILTSEECDKWPIIKKNHIEELKQEIQAVFIKS